MINTWEEKWLQDIEYLVTNLKEKHVNLFAYTDESIFNNKVNNLKKLINNLDYTEMKVEISRLVASIKDAHTAMVFPATKFLPLKFYYYEEGIYVIDSTKEYENLIFKKLTEVEGVSIDKVLDELKDIISFENENFFKAQAMKYIQIADVLYGLLIADDMDKINLNFDGTNYAIRTCSYDDLKYTNTKVPYYWKNSNENLWFEKLNDNKLYIKYNSCRENGNKKIADKICDIIEVMESDAIKDITIDLRNNLGGDSTLLEPLIDYLKGKEHLNIQAVIGRETFSSGLLNAYQLKNILNCKIIGEPSGGKPNCYGEILKFQLPNSKLVVSYSTKYYKLIDDDSVMALYPDEIKLEYKDD